MYPVTTEFRSKIKETSRIFKADIQIQQPPNVLDLTDKDLVLGSFVFSEGSQSGEEFTIGSTVASDLSFTINNKEEYDSIDFDGATVVPTVSLLLSKDLDNETYFLSAPQPSEVEGDSQEIWEPVPIGKYNIDDATRQGNTIQIKAIDNMIKFDKPYNLSILSYPATLYQIYVNACNICDVQVGTTNFPNKDYVVQERPSDDLTFRDVLGYVAELAGCFAKCNRNGAAELKWYTPTGLQLEPSNRKDFKPKDYTVQIKGILYSTEDTSYLAGTDDYVVDISENPLVNGDYDTLLNNIYNNVKDTIFTPYESNWQGNPAIEAGDMITQVDRDGKVYNTLITSSKYKYRGASALSAKGLPEISRGYKGSASKKIANIVRKEIKPIGNQLTTLQQAQLNATELIANMLGGYAHYEADAFYVTDNPILADAQKVWKWGLGGFGYSQDGVDGPYATAITADGSMVAHLVAAGIVTADMIETGILISQDGSTWINLNNGEFNFKNAIRWVNGKLVIEGIPDTGAKIFNTTPVPPYKLNDLWKVTGIAGVDFRICTTARPSGSYVASDWTNVADAKAYTDLIKNLTTGTAISGGTTTIDNTKVRVSHGTGQYSEMNANGFFRQWQYGQGKYINDIYIRKFYEKGDDFGSTRPSPYRIYLPKSFRGRTNVEIYVVPLAFKFSGGNTYSDGSVRGISRWNDMVCRVALLSRLTGQESKDLNDVSPWVDIDVYNENYYKTTSDNESKYYFEGMDWMLMVIGY